MTAPSKPMTERRILLRVAMRYNYIPLGNYVSTISEVYVPKVVIAELIQGAMTEKEIAVIEDFVNAFIVVDQTADTLINLRGDSGLSTLEID